jgi:hypothetical protein
MFLRASTPSGRPATHRDPVPLRVLPSAAEQPRSPVGSRHRQNGMGDVVIPVEHGEIVALPRLWDFDLERVDGAEATLRTDTGLIAVVTLLADTAVVSGVADEQDVA